MRDWVPGACGTGRGVQDEVRGLSSLVRISSEVTGACGSGRGVQDEVRGLSSLVRISSEVRELQRTPFTQSPIGRGTSESQRGRARLGSIVKYGRMTLYQGQCRCRQANIHGPWRRSQGGKSWGGSR